MPRQFRTKNLSVSLSPSSKLAQLNDKLRICVLNTNLCLGYTNCRLLTQYCLGWISWCRFFTCRWGTWVLCDRPWTWVACQAGTHPNCGPATPVIDPGDILIDPDIYARQVAELKADLHEAIRQLDAHEKEIANATKEAGG